MPAQRCGQVPWGQEAGALQGSGRVPHRQSDVGAELEGAQAARVWGRERRTFWQREQCVERKTLELSSVGATSSGVLGFMAVAHSLGSLGGDEGMGSREVRPPKHLDCVRGHGKEVWEGSGWERNLPGTAFEVSVSKRQSQSG